MRRLAAFTTMLILVVVIFESGVSASASPSPARAAAATSPVSRSARSAGSVKPAKVKAGGVWTLEAPAGACESDSFATHHAFSYAITDGSGDRGIYKGKGKLTMTWTAGSATGAVLPGHLEPVDRELHRLLRTLGGGPSPATLVPVRLGGLRGGDHRHPTNVPPWRSGSAEADVATVTGGGRDHPHR